MRGRGGESGGLKSWRSGGWRMRREGIFDFLGGNFLQSGGLLDTAARVHDQSFYLSNIYLSIDQESIILFFSYIPIN